MTDRAHKVLCNLRNLKGLTNQPSIGSQERKFSERDATFVFFNDCHVILKN